MGHDDKDRFVNLAGHDACISSPHCADRFEPTIQWDTREERATYWIGTTEVSREVYLDVLATAQAIAVDDEHEQSALDRDRGRDLPMSSWSEKIAVFLEQQADAPMLAEDASDEIGVRAAKKLRAAIFRECASLVRGLGWT